MFSIQLCQWCFRAAAGSVNGCRACNYRCGVCRHGNPEANPKTEHGHARAAQTSNRTHRRTQHFQLPTRKGLREVTGCGFTASRPIWRWLQGDHVNNIHYFSWFRVVTMLRSTCFHRRRGPGAHPRTRCLTARSSLLHVPCWNLPRCSGREAAACEAPTA